MPPAQGLLELAVAFAKEMAQPKEPHLLRGVLQRQVVVVELRQTLLLRCRRRTSRILREKCSRSKALGSAQKKRSTMSGTLYAISNPAIARSDTAAWPI